MVKMGIKENTVRKHLEQMIGRATHVQAFWKRVIIPSYRKAQKQRWATMNASEGRPWADNRPLYKTWKQRAYKSFPLGGRKVMVATNALFMATIDHVYDISTDTSLTLSVNPNDQRPAVPSTRKGGRGQSSEKVLNYARYAAEERPFMTFGKKTVGDWREKIRLYIKKGGV